MRMSERDERMPRRPGAFERRGSARRRVYVPLRRRSARFLEALAESGNVTLAAEVAGIGKDRIYKLRKDDEAFAATWDAAKAAFAARAEEEDGIDLTALGRDGLAVRRGRGGQVQIVSAHPGAWTKRGEEVFFAHYIETGNVSASARAAGFSGKAAWERAKANPEFRERLGEAKREATERLDFYLIEEGTNLLKGEARDPQLAMWILKRADQQKARTLRRGAAAARRTPTIEEVTENIVRKVEAIKRHKARMAAAEQAGDGGG